MHANNSDNPLLLVTILSQEGSLHGQEKHTYVYTLLQGGWFLTP